MAFRIRHYILPMTPPSEEIGVTLLPVYKKHQKSRITLERCEIEQKSQLITNRKSVFTFQNPTLDFTCNATYRRNWHFVTFGFTKKITKIANNSETVRDRAKVSINH